MQHQVFIYNARKSIPAVLMLHEMEYALINVYRLICLPSLDAWQNRLINSY